MSILSSFVRNISAPLSKVASVIPNPIAQAVSLGAGVIAQDTARRDIKRQQEQQRKEIMEYFGTTGSSTFRDPYASQLVVNQGTSSSGGGFLSGLSSAIKGVGGIVSDVFSTGLPQVFGVARPPSVGQQPALTTVTNIGAQESQGSGSVQAGAGSLIAPVLQGARNFLKTPQGQLALGGGAGIVTSLIGGNGQQMRITRKMKSQARMVLNMTGGNLSAAADILGIDQNTLVMILLKRFRNDGPVVTKAALRKTKQTVRRLKSMCDMYDSLRPTATRRRTPMKRATTTTLIKN